MAWVKPLISRTQVRKAGKAIVKHDIAPDDRGEALAVVNNWRAAHSFPLNSLQMNLRKHTNRVDTNALVYQRLKRMPSIEAKLKREPTMDLARMQDLGGARAVVGGVKDVNAVVRSLSTSRMRHRVVGHDDYIAQPKRSGYRGVHLTYAFESARSPEWNGLIVELQIRTQVQHAWATAVETVSLFTDQALKASNGDERWLRFFVLASSAFAMREGRPVVPDTPEDRRVLLTELGDLTQELNVVSRLTAYTASVDQADRFPSAQYFVLTLDIPKAQLTIRAFESLEQATAVYTEIESQTDETMDVVLVKTDNVATLRQAYPNYFLDTTRFIELLEEVLASPF